MDRTMEIGRSFVQSMFRMWSIAGNDICGDDLFEIAGRYSELR